MSMHEEIDVLFVCNLRHFSDIYIVVHVVNSWLYCMCTGVVIMCVVVVNRVIYGYNGSGRMVWMYGLWSKIGLMGDIIGVSVCQRSINGMCFGCQC